MKKTIILGLLLPLGVAALAADSSTTSDLTASPTTSYGMGEGHATRFGAGLMVGEPTGASLKYFFTDKFALDGGVGWSFHRETDLHLHGDALWHVHDLFDTKEGQLSLYFGAGARVKFRENAEDRFGLRIPLGVSYKFDRAPVDVFVEVAPIIDFTPSTDGSFSVAVGARYWF